ncbi:MAG: tRNA pseudouridine(55) synthase TruB [Rickettsiaceae bacterium]|nr:tRNA pseudouridine(55) synthase TruB [Rickettsiaceae bacterium]
MNNQVNGWLNLYKPKGLSSAYFLSKVKKLIGAKKAGHTGTLDPLAEGVLPVAFGGATKLAGLLIDASKHYEFVVQFGARTATGDAGSDVIERSDHKVKEAEILSILPNFIGEILQIPSKFSAIKIGGVRAYKLARLGEDPKIPERKIKIFSLKLNFFDYEKQIAGFSCECSKGSYIRTLAEDISFCLKNFGFVIDLRRIRVGTFLLRDSVTFDSELFEQKQNSDLKKLLWSDPSLKKHIISSIRPVEYVLEGINKIDVSQSVASMVRSGQRPVFVGASDGFSAIMHENKLVAIGEVNSEVFTVKRVLNL